MSAQLDNLNAELATVQTTVGLVLDFVKTLGNVAAVQADLDTANAGIDAATATAKGLNDQLAAVLPAPAPVPAP